MLVAPLALALALAAGETPAAAPPKFAAALKVKPALRLARQPVPAPPIVIRGGLVPIAMGSAPAPGGSPLVAAGGPGDENVLKAVKLLTTDEGLLDFFRRRTPPAPTKDRLGELVKKLSAKEPIDRDAAQGQLIAIGESAVPLLRQSANNVDDVEGSTRAKECLRNIEGGGASTLAINAARLLATRKPAGAAQVLIGYLPYCEDDQSFQEVEAALVAVAIVNGKPDPAIVQALRDRLALRRGTAAAVLCQAGGAAQYAAVRPLLKDGQASVRLKAALGLVGAFDAEAIPVLIELLSDLPPRLRQEAETYLSSLAGEWAVAGPKGNDLMSRRLRRDVWAAWWKNADGVKLLEEFRSRMVSDEDHAKITALIAKLGDPTAEVRDAASADLITMGKKAASLLRRAANENHPRIGPFAARCLESIEKDTPDPLPHAAPRLLALRKPEGTVETLIGYLPFAESEEATTQIIDILSTVATADAKSEQVLVKALKDPLAIRRASAAMALCRGRATEHLAELRQLLRDKDTTVQLRVAQGLLGLGEKQAVPTLIGLLKDLPLEQVWEVEDYLTRIAGEKSPSEVVSADAASRTRAMNAWTKWWNEAGKTIDLARLDLNDREGRFFLVVEMWNRAGKGGRVMEVDTSGKVRWEIDRLTFPIDVQMLRGGNVLIVEQNAFKVTERTRANKVVWEKVFPQVFHAERLPDGSTFIAQRNQLQIIDRAGKQTFNHFYNMNSILAARRFRDGSIAYVSYSGHYVRLNREGKEVKTVQMNWWNFGLNGAEILPGDHVVASVSNFNKVIEFDGDGKQVWECAVVSPAIPYRLANGHTLVPCNNMAMMVEIDRKGKIAKEWKGLSFQPYRVVKR
jgi:HEAT repeat protein